MEKRFQAVPEESIEDFSRMAYEELSEYPEWLEYLGVESWEDIAERWRAGTWVLPDYKRSTPPSAPTP